MRIQHNIPAMNAYRNYNSNTKALQNNLQKLSSGYKINKAGDDAAGLAISEKMRAQISGLEVAQKNAKDGISLVQTAEGAMTEIHTMLNRMFSLAEQSANGTYEDKVDREQLNNEFQKLTEEIDRIAEATNFNGKKLLDGSIDGSTDKVAADIGTDAAGLTDPDNPMDIADLVKVETESGITDAQKGDFNNALKNGTLSVKFDVAADGTLAAGDKITLSGLPSGYTVTTTDGAGNEIAVGNGVELKFDGTNAGGLNEANPLELSFKDANGVAVGKVTLDLSTAKPIGGKTTAITFKSEASAATAAASAGGAGRAAATPTWTGLAAFGIDSITPNGVTLNDGDTISAEYQAAGSGANNLGAVVITVNKAAGGTDTYQYDLVAGDNATAVAGTTKSAAGTGGATGSFNIAFATGQTVVGVGTTAVPQAQVGTVAAGGGGAGGGGGTGGGTGTTTAGGGLRLRVGDSINTYDNIYVSIKSLKKDAITGTIKDTDRAELNGTTKTLEQLSVANDDDADIAMGVLKDMINYVSTERGNLGATQNRLDHTINNLSTMQENIQDAEATIRDVDVAEEMMKYTKNNILVQSAQAMLAQANQLPQGVLQLLG